MHLLWSQNYLPSIYVHIMGCFIHFVAYVCLKMSLIKHLRYFFQIEPSKQKQETTIDGQRLDKKWFMLATLIVIDFCLGIYFNGSHQRPRYQCYQRYITVSKYFAQCTYQSTAGYNHSCIVKLVQLLGLLVLRCWGVLFAASLFAGLQTMAQHQDIMTLIRLVVDTGKWVITDYTSLLVLVILFLGFCIRMVTNAIVCLSLDFIFTYLKKCF